MQSCAIFLIAIVKTCSNSYLNLVKSCTACAKHIAAVKIASNVSNVDIIGSSLTPSKFIYY